MTEEDQKRVERTMRAYRDELADRIGYGMGHEKDLIAFASVDLWVRFNDKAKADAAAEALRPASNMPSSIPNIPGC